MELVLTSLMWGVIWTTALATGMALFHLILRGPATGAAQTKQVQPTPSAPRVPSFQPMAV